MWEATGCVTSQGVATLNCVPIVFQNIINWAVMLAGVVALFFIIYAGVKYIRSGGEQEKVKSARETLTYAIIGLVVVFLSFGIVRIIAEITGVKCIYLFGFSACGF